MNLIILTAATSSFAFERTLTYELKGTTCVTFERNLESLVTYNELNDVSIAVLSCEDLPSNSIFSHSSIEAKIQVGFETCDTDNYTIKSYLRPSYSFLDENGLRHFLPAIGLRPLGSAPNNRALYGIPLCD